MDLDEDKGVGLPLRLAYSGNHVSFKTGAYGYTGKVSDIKKKIFVRLNTDGSIDYSQDDALRGAIAYTSKYHTGNTV
jgi:hypothetical protein